MKMVLPAVFALCASLFATAAPAQTATYWPYCLRDAYAGSVICGYSSFQQCLSARMGTDDCMANPMPPPARSKRARP